MTLKKYHQKRNFKKTHEPFGRVPIQKNNLFVIQKHAASHLHYDFRLELNGVLLSWAVPKGPCLDPSVKRLAMHVEDHPVEYGSFEGIIPQGQYGGGTVMLWDKGTWQSEDENPVNAYHKGNMSFTLHAEKLHGKWKLLRMGNNDKTWLLIKIKDFFAKSLRVFDITKKAPNSVVSQQTLTEIKDNYQKIWGTNGLHKVNRPKSKKKRQIKLDLSFSPFPKKISPELATLVTDTPIGEDWIHEIKFDGYRLIAFKKKNSIRLITRNHNDWSSQFPEVVNAIKKLSMTTAVFDGEIVILNSQHHADFQLLQNAIKSKKTDGKFIYYLFDLLYYNQYDLQTLPLLERKNLLQKIIPNSDNDILRLSHHITGSGQEIFNNACKMGLEGIVSKLANSFYVQKRSKDWVKTKCTKRQEFIVGGYTQPSGSRQFFGSLYLGTYFKNNKLIYHGNVGTGFTETSLKEIFNSLKKIRTLKMPFTTKPKGITSAIWVKPSLVVEVEFTEWTKEGSLRHPSFKGIRKDKPLSAIRREVPMPIAKIAKTQNANSQSKKSTSIQILPKYKLSHPNKIVYPEDKFTKQDIATYYDAVHEWILPFIINRPLAIVRCPNSYKECFFQKHVYEKSAHVHGVMIREKEKTNKCIYIDNYDGLLALCQMGVLEIHPWGSQIKKIDYPTMVIFDLDPSPELKWEEVVNAAFEIKQYLKDFGLTCFLKTTGGKGLHLVIPIKTEFKWESVKRRTHHFVNLMTQAHPNKYINKMTKEKRMGKIYIDFLRNQRGATAVAAYSTRARIHAPVSTPIHWDELTKNFNDTYFNIKNLPKRLANLKEDPWKDFFTIKQSLKKLSLDK